MTQWSLYPEGFDSVTLGKTGSQYQAVMSSQNFSNVQMYQASYLVIQFFWSWTN